MEIPSPEGNLVLREEIFPPGAGRFPLSWGTPALRRKIAFRRGNFPSQSAAVSAGGGNVSPFCGISGAPGGNVPAERAGHPGKTVTFRPLTEFLAPGNNRIAAKPYVVQISGSDVIF